MTVSSARAARSQISFVSVLVVALASVALTGCPDNHIGRLCDLGLTADASTTSAVTNTGALECPSRICIRPAQERSTDTGALCTAECSSDDDCSESEGRSTNDNTDRRCKGGFACYRLLPGLSQNPLSCKRMCVCKDFLRTGDTTGGNSQNCNGDTPSAQ